MPYAKQKKMDQVPRPDIFSYHDYRIFLREWFDYLKRTSADFSLRDLARRSQLSCAYLPMVLAGSRKLSAKSLEALSPHLGLTSDEKRYLDALRVLSDSESEPARRDALERLQGFRAYREKNAKEFEVYHYLDKWYYVAIREMVALPDFRAEVSWIHPRLKGRVTPGEIRQALRFLSENGYIRIFRDKSAELREKDLECMGGVFRLATRNFHHQMLKLAVDDVAGGGSPEQREVLGYTTAFPQERFSEIKAIIKEAIDRVEAIAKDAKGSDTLYHTCFFAVPLAVPMKEGE